jgi:hypothetical protein
LAASAASIAAASNKMLREVERANRNIWPRGGERRASLTSTTSQRIVGMAVSAFACRALAAATWLNAADQRANSRPQLWEYRAPVHRRPVATRLELADGADSSPGQPVPAGIGPTGV